MSAGKDTLPVGELRDIIAIIAAAGSAVAAFINKPEWPTVALILLVALMGYIIWRMLRAILQQMRQDLEHCQKAHAECSERFQEVLNLLGERRGKARKPKG